MAGLPVVFHPDAVEEAQAARQWYLTRSHSAADSFLAELDRGTEAIALAPDRWPRFVHGTRRYLFQRFPFQLVYRIVNNSVQVVAVAPHPLAQSYLKPRPLWREGRNVRRIRPLAPR
jgi:plasmid stabilization system protein ParE